jgi:hypothetical protein
MTDLFRRAISRLPLAGKIWISGTIALLIYFPLARAALVIERLGLNVEPIPLAAYRRRSLYTMRTDAFDRFGTRLEKRFTQNEIRVMMEQAGLEGVVFSPSVPYWCAVGYKRPEQP